MSGCATIALLAQLISVNSIDGILNLSRALEAAVTNTTLANAYLGVVRNIDADIFNQVEFATFLANIKQLSASIDIDTSVLGVLKVPVKLHANIGNIIDIDSEILLEVFEAIGLIQNISDNVLYSQASLDNILYNQAIWDDQLYPQTQADGIQ